MHDWSGVIDYFAFQGRHSAVRKSARAARARANGASSVCTGHKHTELLPENWISSVDTLKDSYICRFY